MLDDKDNKQVAFNSNIGTSLPKEGRLSSRMSETQAKKKRSSLVKASLSPVPGDKRTLKESVLQIHVGVGIGEMAGMHVGGLRKRWEYIVLGECANFMMHAEVSDTRRGATSKRGWLITERSIRQLATFATFARPTKYPALSYFLATPQIAHPK